MSELLLPGVIRTVVPAVVGTVTAMLFSRFGIVLSDQTSVDMTAAFTTLVTIGYYVAIRVGAKQFPWLEKLLGSSNAPLYMRPSVLPRRRI